MLAVGGTGCSVGDSWAPGRLIGLELATLSPDYIGTVLATAILGISVVGATDLFVFLAIGTHNF